MNKGDKDGIESKRRSGTRSMGRRFILEQSDSPSAAEGIQLNCRADTFDFVGR
jgi:hypothetical protein